jgi:hypothetical protein
MPSARAGFVWRAPQAEGTRLRSAGVLTAEPGRVRAGNIDLDVPASISVITPTVADGDHALVPRLRAEDARVPAGGE